MKSSESCYLLQNSVLSERRNTYDVNHPDSVALTVASKYIRNELFDKVRGEGLAYGVSVSASATDGEASISIYRSCTTHEKV